jgi:hypothetical protein
MGGGRYGGEVTAAWQGCTVAPRLAEFLVTREAILHVWHLPANKGFWQVKAGHIRRVLTAVGIDRKG